MWSSSDKSAEHQVGDTIGPYIIREVIGEGGYGMVYRAHQTKPVQREVALKILKPGMDSRQFISRFEAERQALAMMNHPGVAKVHDAGQTPMGRPYYVMEHVEGVPITRYCDQCELSIAARLDLFTLVCEAVQHAHAKGVVHRDLKPSNILVMDIDGRAAPKVIDFGLAKALHNKLSQETIFTMQGQLIGTPEYMSPEQADMNDHAVDIRSDIYSLGVILYELLTGSLPFPMPDDVGLKELRRMVTDDEPPRPTARLRSDAGARLHAQRRRLDQRALLQRVRGDLEWIVMKCIEKEPSRRYATADALAEDIRRFQRNEPISAGPPGAAYRMKKFVRRNRSGVIAASLAAAALLIATFVSLSYAVGEAHHRRIAQENEQHAIEQTQRALAAEVDAKRRAEELRIVADFQSAMLSEMDVEMMGVQLREDIVASAQDVWSRAEFDEDSIRWRLEAIDSLLGGVNFTTTAVKSMDRNVLSRSLEAIDKDFADQPLVRASLLESVAATYCNLGMLEQGLMPRQRALQIRRSLLGSDHEATMGVMHELGLQYFALGRHHESVMLLQEAIERRTAVLGEEHPDTLKSICGLSMTLTGRGELEEAEQLCRGVLAVRMEAFGPEYEDTLQSIDMLGQITGRQGQTSEAEALFREAYEGRKRTLGQEHPSTLTSLNNLARTLRELGRFAEAERYFRDAMDTRRRVLGDSHPATLNAINNVGRALREQNRIHEAERYYREAMEGFERVFGPNHPDTLTTVNNMGRVMRSLGRLGEAENFYRRALLGRKEVLGDDHMDTLTSLNNLGFLFQSQRRYDEAEPYLLRALEGLQRTTHPHHPNTIRATSNIGLLLRDMERSGEAERFLREAVAGFRSAFDRPDHIETLNAMANLANLLRSTGQLDEAESIGREVVDRSRESPMIERRHFGLFLLNYGLTLQALGQFELAEAALLECHEIYQQEHGERHSRTLNVSQALADLYNAWHAAEPNGGYDEQALVWN